MALLVPGILLVDGIRQAAESLDGSLRDADIVSELRGMLDRTMTALGGVFTIALLATAALRDVVNSEEEGLFGQTRLLLFGVQFSAILLVAYWPAQSALNTRARAIRNSARPLPDLRAPDLVDVQKARTTIDGLLGSSDGPIAGFRARASIVAPLVVSLLASLVAGS